MAEQRRGIEAWLLGRSRTPGARIDPLLRALLEAASPGLALLDPADRILLWNAELARLAGPTLPLREGLPLASLLVPDARDGVAMALDAGRQVEVSLAAAGAPRVMLDVRPVHEAGVSGVLRVMPVAAARDTAEGAAAARLQSVGALAGGIAHDFNNLLTAIRGSAEAALARDAAPRWCGSSSPSPVSRRCARAWWS
mgnify:CR=1 FL=1